MSRHRLLSFLILSITTACATTGATVGSGVGDAMLSNAPWYAGARSTPVAAPAIRTGTLPIAYQPRNNRGLMIDPAAPAGSPIAALLAEMNASLQNMTSFNGTQLVLLVSNDPAVSQPAMRGVPPDVRFGCLTEGNMPGEDCVARGDSVLGRVPNLNQMQLAVGRPSPEWTTWYAELLGQGPAQYGLVITLEIGEYFVRQSGASGRKSVQLGSNHVQDIPWLTSLEQPVQVIQLTGALVGRDGKAIRIGSEGIMAKRSRLIASAVGVTELISDDDVEALRSRRRDDLPGRPLAWEEALRQLVHGLTR